MPSSDAVVRHARRQDASAILDLIQALADYEKESDAVEATVESLLNTIAFAPDDGGSGPPATPNTEPTSPSRPARCLLLFSPEGIAVGMALYFYNYSTWRSRHGIYLEDLFVQPSERGKGYGKRLLVELAKQVVASNGGRLEWAVLKWNEPSINFYQSIGASAMTEWVGMRVDGPALDKLAHLLD
ncbi:acetyltransferase [Ophiocordyceps sinensis CO18]|uniref:Acetyltransferase n=1 Tax=Ophiocordyceps sinensis (strain Co18 / CGMCC 3.14243) TaxID=911162 RepID=T5AD16_OPHSC|nr:acetyltransferase [Ophiocordyceps sinensis CO18]